MWAPVEEHRELLRKEVVDTKRALNEEVSEKEAGQRTCADLRNTIKKAEADKTELARVLQEARHRIGGVYTVRVRVRVG
jgi:hypothetical protein